MGSVVRQITNAVSSVPKTFQQASGNITNVAKSAGRIGEGVVGFNPEKMVEGARGVGEGVKGLAGTVATPVGMLAAPTALAPLAAVNSKKLGKDIGRAGSGITQNVIKPASDKVAKLGVLGYTNPITAMPRLAGDFARGERKKREYKEAEAQAAEQAAASRAKLDEIRNQMLGVSKSYREGMGAQKQGLLGQEARGVKRSLAAQIRDLENEYNRRGLLGSGIQQRKKADAYSQARADLASRESAIDDDLRSQADQMDMDVAQYGLEMSGMQGAEAADAYTQRLRALQAQQQALNSLLGAAGQTGGYLAGRRA